MHLLLEGVMFVRQFATLPLHEREQALLHLWFGRWSQGNGPERQVLGGFLVKVYQ